MKLVGSRRPVGKVGETHGVFPGLSIGDRACAVRRGSAQPTVHKFTAPARHGVRRPAPSPPLIGRGKPRPVFASRAPDADAADYTRRRDNAHKIEELEVLYQWHPWFGRVVHVHEVIEQRAGGVLRCSPDGDASRRWLELPQWMFDRAACLAIRMAASPRVDTAALITLKTCLADASGTGLCGGPLSNASASGAGRSSCNLDQGAARATQVPPPTQPSSRRQAVRSFRSARLEAPDPGVRVATAAGEDPRDGDRADGAPPHRPPTPRSRAQLDGKAR